MKKGLILVSVYLIVFASNLFSQNSLKDMVCVVKPTLSEETKTIFSEYALQLTREGYMTSGRYLKVLAGTSSGSGFIVKYNDQYCVFTNNHVVEYADSVVLEFQTDEKTVEYRHCKVFLRNKLLDFALIELPAEHKATQSFTFLTPTPKDGTEVWSAGFPGLGNSPSWQLGKGIISNRNNRNPEFVNASISSVIQHTAQVDAGSSGGPLLLETSKNNVGYEVIGINTWKAIYREGTNFAVPAVDLTRFLDSMKRVPAAVLDQSKATNRMKDFASIMKSKTTSYKDILPFVSNDFYRSVSAKHFILLIHDASDSARIKASEFFRQAEPFEGIRIIIADAIWRQRTNPMIFGTITATDLTSPIKGDFLENSKPVQTEWRYENGDYVMSSYSALLSKLQKAEKISAYDPEKNVFVALSIPTHDWESNVYEFGITRYMSKYFGFVSFATTFSQITIPPRNEYEEEEKSVNISMQFYNPVVQYPFVFDRFYIIPHLRIPLGLNVGPYASLFTGVYPGVKFGLGLKKNKCLYLGLEYRMQFRKYLNDDITVTTRPQTFGVTLGFEY